MNEIRVHPRGEGRQTDYQKVAYLKSIAPRSFSVAQQLLTAAKGFCNRSNAARFKKVTHLIWKLRGSLAQEAYLLLSTQTLGMEAIETASMPDFSGKHALFRFLSEVSDALPNWQDEYIVLNRIIETMPADVTTYAPENDTGVLSSATVVWAVTIAALSLNGMIGGVLSQNSNNYASFLIRLKNMSVGQFSEGVGGYLVILLIVSIIFAVVKKITKKRVWSKIFFWSTAIYIPVLLLQNSLQNRPIRQASQVKQIASDSTAKKIPFRASDSTANSVSNRHQTLVETIPAPVSSLPKPTVPKFTEYPVSATYTDPRPRAPVVLVSEFDRAFRTHIRHTEQLPVNFAGEYVLTAWGCGADCLMGVATNARTGTVSPLPGTICCWEGAGDKVIYRQNSRLIVLAGLIDEKGVYGAHFYKIKNDEFVHIHTVPINEDNMNDIVQPKPSMDTFYKELEQSLNIIKSPHKLEGLAACSNMANLMHITHMVKNKFPTLQAAKSAIKNDKSLGGIKQAIVGAVLPRAYNDPLFLGRTPSHSGGAFFSRCVGWEPGMVSEPAPLLLNTEERMRGAQCATTAVIAYEIASWKVAGKTLLTSKSAFPPNSSASLIVDQVYSTPQFPMPTSLGHAAFTSCMGWN